MQTATRAGPYEPVVRFFDELAPSEDAWLEKTAGYHERVRDLYRALVPPGQRVLEIGSGRGDLLAALEPARGVGVDVSPAMVDAARGRHPGITFHLSAGEEVALEETFDFIVLSDLVPYVDDLQRLFATVAAHSVPSTRVIVSTYSNLWRLPLALLARAGLRPRRPVRNWVAPRDLQNLFELAGLEVITERKEILLPTRSGNGLAALVNGALVRIPGLRSLALTSWIIGRPAPSGLPEAGVSVVVPCRNEAGSIEALVERIPDMGAGTEIVFVEGHSEDGTREVIEGVIARRGDRDISLVVQSGKGKANAVREGFERARHEILMILDGDVTVAPEDLAKFYDALASGRGELANGTRLVYGMEPGAMRFINMIGNKAFASLMSWVLGQYVKDTLCGTKAIRRHDYELIRARLVELGAEDPYGDFDLLIGAALAGLKIVDIPVRYSARGYGESQISRFSGAAQLFRVTAAGFRRIWLEPARR